MFFWTDLAKTAICRAFPESLITLIGIGYPSNMMSRQAYPTNLTIKRGT
jgi:hypothetical protein